MTGKKPFNLKTQPIRLMLIVFSAIIAAITIIAVMFGSTQGHEEPIALNDTPIKQVADHQKPGVYNAANGKKLTDLTAADGDSVYDAITLTSNSKLYKLKVSGLTARLNFKPDGGGNALHADQTVPDLVIPKNGSASVNSPNFSPANFGFTNGKWKAGTYYFDIITTDKTKWTNADDGTAAQMSVDLNLMGEGVASETFTVKPAPITVGYKAKKVWNKGTNKANITDFKVNFYLKGNGTGDVKETKNFDANGNVTFAYTDTFTADDIGKTFNRSAKEVDTGLPGVQYDTDVQMYSVTISNDHGVLKATMTPSDATVTFTNDNVVNDASATITASKSFIGAQTSTTKITDFEFKLYDSNDKVLQTTHPAENGKVTFQPIKYTAADMGGALTKQFKYYVMETKGTADNGITYDTHKAGYVVTVTDNRDGTLTAVAKSDGSSSTTFVNRYRPIHDRTATVLKVKKVFQNADRSNAKITDFQFQLRETTDGKNALKETKNADANGNVAFKTISYPDSALVDADGNRVKSKTFTYTVNEVQQTAGGVTYDKTVKNFSVTVTDDGQGNLNAVTTPNPDTATPTFTNTYTPAPVEVTFGAKKVFTNAAMSTTPITSFEFKLYDANGTVLQTAHPAEDGTIGFQPIQYTMADMGTAKSKTWNYTVKETAGNAPGVTYDTHTAKYSVTVTDPGDGQLVATQSSTDADTTFTNTYKPKDASVTLKAKKTFENANMSGVKITDFEFVLTDDTGKTLQTKHPAASGLVTFDPIKYTQAELAGAKSKTFAYKVKETQGNAGGVTYDTSVKTYTVTVTDNGQGALNITTTPNPDTATPSFKNSFTVSPAHVTPKATKVFENKDLSKTDITTFEFSLYSGDKAQGTALQTAHPAADGSITFQQLNYTMVDLGGRNTLDKTYSIKETKGKAGGVTYTDKIGVFTVHLVNNMDGTMSATLTQPTGQNMTFTNEYHATPTSFTPSAVKSYTFGGNKVVMTDNMFQFELKDDKGKLLETVGNKADGSITFSKLDYTKAGTYSYTITEKAGDDKRIQYDPSKHTLTVTVTDDGFGKLSATAKYDNTTTKPTFNNGTRSAVSMPLTGSYVDTGTLTRSVFTAMSIGVLITGGIILLSRRREMRKSDANGRKRHGRG
ncbi:FctA domain-containing protein [Bifidobacterium sp. SO1]|uniref:Spy0128 family protein n=1 Tax=Bifidobacterium sp. SO1 TaxID=2809029 RepID=UPI001BDC3B00|nr:FctA domain-containing protein [Bifidobacterium sp. SO1]MBT1162749.1 Cna B-type domain-containing protein [Bifidobacterium sp. SO1]